MMPPARRTLSVPAIALACGVALVAAPALADCTLSATGKVPLNDLGPGLYQGFSGGLYPGGANTRPPAHEAAGLAQAALVQPRDSSGIVDPAHGRIVMVSIGISNTSQEFASGGAGAFRGRILADPSRNPRLELVNCAQGGHTAADWSSLADSAWIVADQRVAAAGCHPEQVQVAWVKLAELVGQTPDNSFPAHAQWHQGNVAQTLRHLRARYPHLALAFISGRTRSYAPFGTAGNPEPIAYEESFGLKWLIESQIGGAPDLEFDPAQGPVVAPYLAWGPYLWADGEVPRSDGLVWHCSDLLSDFTHPSPAGVAKVADQLIAFFKTDPLATPWFLRPTVTGQPPSCTITADVAAGNAPLTVHFGAAAVDPDGTIVEHAWSFDDGGSSLAAAPVKVYPVPGTYTVRLTVTDDAGNPVTASRTITVHASAVPIASRVTTVAAALALLAAAGLGLRRRPLRTARGD